MTADRAATERLVDAMARCVGIAGARELLAGPVGEALAAAKREAWDEGYQSGYDQHTGLGSSDDSNPYRPTCRCRWVADPVLCASRDERATVRVTDDCKVHG